MVGQETAANLTQEIIPRRANDILGVGFAYTGLALGGTSGLASARTYEALVEICYTAQLKAGWTLQPDFQYIWQPSGGSEPSGKGTILDAAVWGGRTTINF
jgi:porin